VRLFFPAPDRFLRLLSARGFFRQVLEHDAMILGGGILELEKNRTHILDLSVRLHFQARDPATRKLQHLLHLAGGRRALRAS